MKMRKCKICGKYTLMDIHCNIPTVSAHPPPFNLNDKYVRYRVEWRKGNNKNEEKDKKENDINK